MLKVVITMSSKKSKGSTEALALEKGLSNVLSVIHEQLGAYFVISLAQRYVIALWIVHTHCIGAVNCTPYTYVTSPEKECGKSRLLEFSSLLVYKPLSTCNISSAAIAQVVAAEKPTLIIDEADTFL
jgi:hypothetical protein